MRIAKPPFFMVAGLIVVLGGCLPKLLPQKTGDPQWGVEIEYYGHSCFSLRDSLGRTVVIDPFDETTGLGWLRLRADALLITHSHFDHNNKQAVKARSRDVELVVSTGITNVASGFVVNGIPSFHDKARGNIHGDNTIFVFTLGGIRFAHMGDFGQLRLTPAQLSSMGSIDVLMIPVGGKTTIDAKTAKTVISEINPSVVIPMHYGHRRFYDFDPIDKFTALFDPEQIVTIEDPSVRIKAAEFDQNPKIYLLSPLPLDK